MADERIKLAIQLVEDPKSRQAVQTLLSDLKLFLDQQGKLTDDQDKDARKKIQTQIDKRKEGFAEELNAIKRKAIEEVKANENAVKAIEGLFDKLASGKIAGLNMTSDAVEKAIAEQLAAEKKMAEEASKNAKQVGEDIAEQLLKPFKSLEEKLEKLFDRIFKSLELQAKATTKRIKENVDKIKTEPSSVSTISARRSTRKARLDAGDDDSSLIQKLRIELVQLGVQLQKIEGDFGPDGITFFDPDGAEKAEQINLKIRETLGLLKQVESTQREQEVTAAKRLQQIEKENRLLVLFSGAEDDRRTKAKVLLEIQQEQTRQLDLTGNELEESLQTVARLRDELKQLNLTEAERINVAKELERQNEGIIDDLQQQLKIQKELLRSVRKPQEGEGDTEAAARINQQTDAINENIRALERSIAFLKLTEEERDEAAKQAVEREKRRAAQEQKIRDQEAVAAGIVGQKIAEVERNKLAVKQATSKEELRLAKETLDASQKVLAALIGVNEKVIKSEGDLIIAEQKRIDSLPKRIAAFNIAIATTKEQIAATERLIKARQDDGGSTVELEQKLRQLQANLETQVKVLNDSTEEFRQFEVGADSAAIALKNISEETKRLIAAQKKLEAEAAQLEEIFGTTTDPAELERVIQRQKENREEQEQINTQLKLQSRLQDELGDAEKLRGARLEKISEIQNKLRNLEEELLRAQNKRSDLEERLERFKLRNAQAIDRRDKDAIENLEQLQRETREAIRDQTLLEVAINNQRLALTRVKRGVDEAGGSFGAAFGLRFASLLGTTQARLEQLVGPLENISKLLKAVRTTDLVQAFQILTGRLKETDAAVTPVAAGLANIGRSAAPFLAVAAATAVLGLSIKGLIDLVKQAAVSFANFSKQAIENLVEVQKGQERIQALTGASIENITAFTLAFQTIKGDANDVADIFAQIAERVQAVKDGSKEAATDFENLGISFEELARSDINEILEKLISNFDKLPPSIAKTAAIGLVGEEGARQFVVLNEKLDEFRERAKRAGVVIDEDLANALKIFRRASEDVTINFQAFSNVLAEKLLPSAIGVAESLAEILEEVTELLDSSPTLAVAFETLDRVVTVFGQNISALIIGLKSLGSVTGPVSQGFTVLSLSLLTFLQASERLNRLALGEGLTSDIESLARVLRRGSDASEELTNAQKLAADQAEDLKNIIAGLNAEYALLRQRLEDNKAETENSIKSTKRQLDLQIEQIKTLRELGQLPAQGQEAGLVDLPKAEVPGLPGVPRIPVGGAISEEEALRLIEESQQKAFDITQKALIDRLALIDQGRAKILEKIKSAEAEAIKIQENSAEKRLELLEILGEAEIEKLDAAFEKERELTQRQIDQRGQLRVLEQKQRLAQERGLTKVIQDSIQRDIDDQKALLEQSNEEAAEALRQRQKIFKEILDDTPSFVDPSRVEAARKLLDDLIRNEEQAAFARTKILQDDARELKKIEQARVDTLAEFSDAARQRLQENTQFRLRLSDLLVEKEKRASEERLKIQAIENQKETIDDKELFKQKIINNEQLVLGAIEREKNILLAQEESIKQQISLAGDNVVLRENLERELADKKLDIQSAEVAAVERLNDAILQDTADRIEAEGRILGKSLQEFDLATEAEAEANKKALAQREITNEEFTKRQIDRSNKRLEQEADSLQNQIQIAGDNLRLRESLERELFAKLVEIGKAEIANREAVEEAKLNDLRRVLERRADALNDQLKQDEIQAARELRNNEELLRLKVINEEEFTRRANDLQRERLTTEIESLQERLELVKNNAELTEQLEDELQDKRAELGKFDVESTARTEEAKRKDRKETFDFTLSLLEAEKSIIATRNENELLALDARIAKAERLGDIEQANRLSEKRSLEEIRGRLKEQSAQRAVLVEQLRQAEVELQNNLELQRALIPEEERNNLLIQQGNTLLQLRQAQILQNTDAVKFFQKEIERINGLLTESGRETDNLTEEFKAVKEVIDGGEDTLRNYNQILNNINEGADTFRRNSEAAAAAFAKAIDNIRKVGEVTADNLQEANDQLAFLREQLKILEEDIARGGLGTFSLALRDLITEEINRLREAIAEAEAARRREDAQARLDDLLARRQNLEDQITDIIENAQERREELEERHQDRLAELAMRRAEVEAEIEESITKATEDFNERRAEIIKDFEERQAERRKKEARDRIKLEREVQQAILDIEREFREEAIDAEKDFILEEADLLNQIEELRKQAAVGQPEDQREQAEEQLAELESQLQQLREKETKRLEREAKKQEAIAQAQAEAEEIAKTDPERAARILEARKRAIEEQFDIEEEFQNDIATLEEQGNFEAAQRLRELLAERLMLLQQRTQQELAQIEFEQDLKDTIREEERQKELDAFNERLADLKESFDKQIDEIKKRGAERLAEIEKQLADENKAFKDAIAELTQDIIKRFQDLGIDIEKLGGNIEQFINNLINGFTPLKDVLDAILDTIQEISTAAIAATANAAAGAGGGQGTGSTPSGGPGAKVGSGTGGGRFAGGGNPSGNPGGGQPGQGGTSPSGQGGSSPSTSPSGGTGGRRKSTREKLEELYNQYVKGKISLGTVLFRLKNGVAGDLTPEREDFLTSFFESIRRGDTRSFEQALKEFRQGKPEAKTLEGVDPAITPNDSANAAGGVKVIGRPTRTSEGAPSGQNLGQKLQAIYDGYVSGQIGLDEVIARLNALRQSGELDSSRFNELVKFFNQIQPGDTRTFSQAIQEFTNAQPRSSPAGQPGGGTSNLQTTSIGQSVSSQASGFNRSIETVQMPSFISAPLGGEQGSAISTASNITVMPQVNIDTVLALDKNQADRFKEEIMRSVGKEMEDRLRNTIGVATLRR